MDLAQEKERLKAELQAQRQHREIEQRGYYLHPELFGAPKEKSIASAPHAAAPAQELKGEKGRR